MIAPARAAGAHSTRRAVVVILALAALPACDGGARGPRWRAAGNATPRDGGTLRYATKDQVRTLDPTIQYDEWSTDVVHLVFDQLVDYEPEGFGLVPRLAERWEVSPDGLRYRFTLRPGIAFSDGVAVEAAHVKFSLERARAAPDSPFGPFLIDIAPDGISTPSSRELEIRLARPNAAFIYVFAMPFTTPQRPEHVAASGDQLRRRPLGTGPFVLAEWDEGRRLVLRRNPNYWDRARVHLDAIELYENVSRETQFLMFERGELDMVDKLAAPDLLWIDEQPDWQPYIHRSTTLTAFGTRMNTRVKPFDDRRVRQALNYALDKRHSVKLLNGAAVAAHGMLPPGMFGRAADLEPYPYDPARARALLAQAGYPDGLALDYVVLGDEEAEKLAASMQADYAAVGVRLRISLVSFATWATVLGDPRGAPFAKVSWLGDYPDPSNFLDVKFHSRMIAEEHSNNWSFYTNQEVDTLLDAARGERDPHKREAIYHRVERILHDDAPWVWDYHQLRFEVRQPYLRGPAPHPIWMRDLASAWLDLGPRGERIPR